MAQTIAGELGHPVVDVGFIPSSAGLASESTLAAAAADIESLADGYPLNARQLRLTATSPQAAKVVLAAGGVYWFKVMPAAADLATNVGVYIGFGAAADTNSLIWTANDGILPLAPTASLTLNLLRVGSADVYCMVLGLNAASTTTAP